MYPSGRKVQAASAGFPPPDEFVLENELVASLKFSISKVDGNGVPASEEEEVNVTLCPAQIDKLEALTVTVGAGTITTETG